MKERRQSSVEDENEQKYDSKELSYIHKFILEYEKCPSLWNPKDENYLNNTRRKEELNKLALIYKHIKPCATSDDVRKKINSLRSNYRKELKKIENSNSSYQPTSTTFHLLKFLENIDKGEVKKDDGSTEARRQKDNYLAISSSPPVKIKKNSPSLARQNSLPKRTCPLPFQPSTSSQQDIEPVALVWSDKLKSLNPIQRLYAEKAIHDILFEAQLNNLHRHSVLINAFATPSSPNVCKPSPDASQYVVSHELEDPIPDDDDCET